MGKIKVIYYRFCDWIGYTITCKHCWNPHTFTIDKRNSYLILFKFVGKRDDAGWRKLKEILRIKIR